jgi:hypothetical protein
MEIVNQIVLPFLSSLIMLLRAAMTGANMTNRSSNGGATLPIPGPRVKIMVPVAIVESRIKRAMLGLYFLWATSA